MGSSPSSLGRERVELVNLRKNEFSARLTGSVKPSQDPAARSRDWGGWEGLKTDSKTKFPFIQPAPKSPSEGTRRSRGGIGRGDASAVTLERGEKH